MKEIQFKIFRSKEGLQLSPNLVVYPFLGIFLFLIFINDQFIGNATIESIGVSACIITIFPILYFKVVQWSTRQSLNGHLNEEVKFRENEIQVDKLTYQLSDIKKLDFSILDYYDKLEYPVAGDLNPARSNGVNNLCEFTFLDGQKMEVHFQIMYEGQFLKMRELLIHYYAHNKVHFLNLIEYLGINKYEEIQEFKKKLIQNLKETYDKNEK